MWYLMPDGHNELKLDEYIRAPPLLMFIHIIDVIFYARPLMWTIYDHSYELL